MPSDDRQLNRYILNPYFVYYHCPRRVADEIDRYGWALTRDQKRWVSEYLDIDRSVYGDPVAAVAYCCAGRSAACRHTTQPCDYFGYDETGKPVWLQDILRRAAGDDMFRCRNICHKLFDRLEWECINRSSTLLPLPKGFSEEILLRYAVDRHIGLLPDGESKWGEYCPPASPPCAEFEEMWEYEEAPRRKNIYVGGWSPELDGRLRDALRGIPFQVDGDPVGIDTVPAPVADGEAMKPTKNRTGPKIDHKRQAKDMRVYKARKSGTPYSVLENEYGMSLRDLRMAYDRARGTLKHTD